eukprot:gene6620-16458_t
MDDIEALFRAVEKDREQSRIIAEQDARLAALRDDGETEDGETEMLDLDDTKSDQPPESIRDVEDTPNGTPAMMEPTEPMISFLRMTETHLG